MHNSGRHFQLNMTSLYTKLHVFFFLTPGWPFSELFVPLDSGIHYVQSVMNGVWIPLRHVDQLQFIHVLNKSIIFVSIYIVKMYFCLPNRLQKESLAPDEVKPTPKRQRCCNTDQTMRPHILWECTGNLQREWRTAWFWDFLINCHAHQQLHTTLNCVPRQMMIFWSRFNMYLLYKISGTEPENFVHKRTPSVQLILYWFSKSRECFRQR